MRKLKTLFLILIISNVFVLNSFAEIKDPSKYISVDFDQAALSDILFLVSEKTGDSFVLAVAPKTKLTWVQKDIPVTRLTSNFLNALTSIGLIVQMSDGVLLITDSSSPVATSVNSLSYYRLRYISSDVLKETSEVLYRNRMAINPLEGTPVVLLAGDPVDVTQFIKLLKSIDIPDEPAVSSYRFKHISTRSGMSALEATKSISDNSYYPDYFNRSIILKGDEIERNIAISVLKRIDVPQVGWVDSLEYIHITEAQNIIDIVKASCGSVTPYIVASDRILLSGPEKDVQIASALIHKIDGSGMQVKVEAVIAYLTDKEYKDLGTRLKISTNNFRFSLNDPLLGNALSLLSEDIETFFNFTVKAEEKENHGQIISSPVLTVLNGKTARLHVGQNVPLETSRNVDKNDGQSTATSIERHDIGVTFQITPTITPDGEFVYVKLDQIISQITPSSDLDQDFSDAVFDKQELSSSIKIANGNTVFLGGLAVDEKGNYLEKIPLLGDIPLLGNLFTYRSDKIENRNLVVSLRVNVI
ncbi:MAG: hypothetical protein OCC45_13295 [Desulfotalea sp.]